MKIRIITVGNLKNPAFRSLEQDFLKQLKKYATVEVVCIKDNSTPDRILKALGTDEIIIALDEHGKQFTSYGFAEFLGKSRDLGDHLAFVIGGPFGLPAEVLKAADLKLSLSEMTLLHEMAYVLLLEQIFRGFSINAGSGYQK